MEIVGPIMVEMWKWIFLIRFCNIYFDFGEIFVGSKPTLEQLHSWSTQWGTTLTIACETSTLNIVLFLECILIYVFLICY